MDKNLRTPSLRFKGFTDDWEQCKLSQFYDFSKGKGLSLDSFYEGKDSLGIAYGHLYTKYTEVINKVNLSTYDDNGVLSRKGDLLFPGSSTVPFGTAQSNAIMLDNVKLGGDVIIARAKDLSVYAPFVSYQINAQRSKLFPITVGTTITHMYGKDIANIEYMFPKFDEQEKIGRTLESLDSLITLHQRKYDKFVNIKKSLLEKMFPQNGESIPRLRFKGFTDAWEQCKVGELGRIVTGNTPPTTITDYYSDDGLIWVTPTDINQNITTSTARMLSEKGELVARIVPPNTILVTCIASIGKNTLLGSKGSFNQQINALVPAPKNDSYFLFTQSNHWSSHMKRLGGALTFQIVNKKEFSEIDTLVPQPDEQKKIGSLFNQLDSLITLHQRKYEKLQNIKKALLQKMFV